MPHRIFLSIFLFNLILFGYTFCSEEEFVVIDSLNGKAEVQRAGQQKWVLVRKNTKLYNNDIIRVLERSLARIKWQNGSIIYVNSQSQILINLYRDSVNNKISQLCDCFFWSSFFHCKKDIAKRNYS